MSTITWEGNAITSFDETYDNNPDWIYPDAEWEPLVYTTPLSRDAWTRGDEVIDFAADFMSFTRGFKAGEPLIFSSWQKWLIRCMLEENDEGLLRFRRFICLLPRKNGKSLIGAAIVLHALVFSTPGDQIFSVARDRQQAKIVFKEVKEQVLRSPYLSEWIEVRKDYLVNKITGVEYKALSSDGMSAQGFAPTLVVADELHGWAERGRDLYSAMTEGSSDRLESIFIGISTAGATTESLLGELCEYGSKVAAKQEAGEDFDNTFGYTYWGAAEDEDPTDEEVWKKANPNLASGMMSIADFRSSIAQAEATSLNSFLRYHLNLWVRTDGAETFITASQWENACMNPGSTLKPGTEITLGFDGSISDDNTGLVAIEVESGAMHVLALWRNETNDPDWSVPREDVLTQIENALDTYVVKAFYSDPTFFQTDIEMLSRKYRRTRFSAIWQSRSRMAPMTAGFKLGITNGQLKHSGDLRLREHVLNAILKPSGMVAKEKARSPKKIDLLVCAILAYGAREEVLEKVRAKQALRRK